MIALRRDVRGQALPGEMTSHIICGFCFWKFFVKAKAIKVELSLFENTVPTCMFVCVCVTFVQAGGHVCVYATKQELWLV